jgi:hypothetical protein
MGFFLGTSRPMGDFIQRVIDSVMIEAPTARWEEDYTKMTIRDPKG